MSKLADYLSACRMHAGKTQKEVADHLGFTSPQFVSNIERGIAKPPLQSLKRYAEFIDAHKDRIERYWVKEFKYVLRKQLGVEE